MVKIRNKNIEDETKEIIKFYNSDKVNIQRTLENQFSVIYQRSQVLLSLCGIIISVTGFSGKSIVLTSVTSRVLLITGLLFVLVSGILAIWGVIRFKWISQWYEEDLFVFIRNVLERREKKSVFFHISIILLIIGLTLYVSSISFMLLYIN